MLKEGKKRTRDVYQNWKIKTVPKVRASYKEMYNSWGDPRPHGQNKERMLYERPTREAGATRLRAKRPETVFPYTGQSGYNSLIVLNNTNPIAKIRSSQ